MKDEHSVDALMNTAMKDEDERVRSAAVNALGKQKPSDEIIESVAALAGTEQDRKVRSNIINYMGNVKSAFPDVKTNLEEMLTTETDPGNRVLIYKALYSKRFK